MCKKILKNNTDQPLTFTDLQKFTKQFDILFILKHPNICRAIGINLHEMIADPNINSNDNEVSTVSIFLEYEEYKLIDILNKLNISNTLKVKIAIEIAHALKYIHQNGLIYRDLKIENIMLNSVFETKLIDFGLVRIHECLNPNFSFVSDSLTKGLGTFAYMSPEMLNEEDYDYKTDVYSYGVVLYYIFVGTLPKQNLKNKLTGKEIPLPLPSPSISKYCIELISKCMKSDPKERPTFDDILVDMRNHSYLLATNIDYDIVHNRNKELSL